jgi:primosomal protein N''
VVALALAGAGALALLAAAAMTWAALASTRIREADSRPRAESERLSSPGMDEGEVWRRLVALDELIEMRNDEMDKEQRKAQRERGSLPGV